MAVLALMLGAHFDAIHMIAASIVVIRHGFRHDLCRTHCLRCLGKMIVRYQLRSVHSLLHGVRGPTVEAWMALCVSLGIAALPFSASAEWSVQEAGVGVYNASLS